MGKTSRVQERKVAVEMRLSGATFKEIQTKTGHDRKKLVVLKMYIALGLQKKFYLLLQKWLSVPSRKTIALVARLLNK